MLAHTAINLESPVISNASSAQGGASRLQTNTCETGGFVLSGRVKQRKHESADVSFCDPVQSTGYSKQTM
jgi:hypothetical protein